MAFDDWNGDGNVSRSEQFYTDWSTGRLEDKYTDPHEDAPGGPGGCGGGCGGLSAGCLLSMVAVFCAAPVAAVLFGPWAGYAILIALGLYWVVKKFIL